jgi:hypothetical protein
MSNLITFQKTQVVSVEVESFPSYYKHERIQFFIMITSPEESLKIFDAETFPSISITRSNSVREAFEDGMIPCTKEEFDSALESMYEKITSIRSISLHQASLI